jgi:hypothetical protein
VRRHSPIVPVRSGRSLQHLLHAPLQPAALPASRIVILLQQQTDWINQAANRMDFRRRLDG